VAAVSAANSEFATAACRAHGSHQPDNLRRGRWPLCEPERFGL